MMIQLPKFLLFLVIGCVCYGFSFGLGLTSSPYNKNVEVSDSFGLKARADSAIVYCKKNGLSIKFCFLVDFSIHSGKKRFFIWDFEGDSVICSSLCAHGYGKNSTRGNPVFSNVEGSYCSSLGHYKVGARSYSNWGIHVHYKLHGLESSNSNAFKRMIVLHSYGPVPCENIYPSHLPLGMSQGCPVICNEAMRQADIMLKKEKAPVLLWIYN